MDTALRARLPPQTVPDDTRTGHAIAQHGAVDLGYYTSFAAQVEVTGLDTECSMSGRLHGAHGKR